MAWDTGNDKMVVPASDGPRNVGGTHKNHPERLNDLVRVANKCSATGTTRSRAHVIWFLNKAHDLTTSLGFVDRGSFYYNQKALFPLFLGN